MSGFNRMDQYEVIRKIPGDDFRRPDIWEVIATVGGQEEQLTGAEFVAAQQTNQRHASKIRIRWSWKLRDMTSADRLRKVWDKTEYEITSVTTINELWLDVMLQRLPCLSMDETN